MKQKRIMMQTQEANLTLSQRLEIENLMESIFCFPDITPSLHKLFKDLCEIRYFILCKKPILVWDKRVTRSEYREAAYLALYHIAVSRKRINRARKYHILTLDQFLRKDINDCDVELDNYEVTIKGRLKQLNIRY